MSNLCGAASTSDMAQMALAMKLPECLLIVQGFEMNPEEWIPYKNLWECEAMDVWEKRLGIVDA